MLAPSPLRLPITAIQIGTVVMLMRSVALDRWITVAASLLLLGACAAAARGRTWGVSLAFVVGVTFVGLCTLGIAPPMFALLGFLAARPFARMFRHFLAFDRGAAILLTSVATALGAAGALAWKAYAHDLFAAFPLLTPSAHLHHGILVALIGAVASFVALMSGKRAPAAEARTETHVRVAHVDPEAAALTSAEADALIDSDLEHEYVAARRS